MRYIAPITLAAMMIAGGTPVQAQAPQNNTAVNIMQATADVEAGKCADALPILAQLWNDASLKASDPDLAAQFRAKRVLCTAEVSGPAAALPLSTENLTLAPVTVDAYGLHAFLQLSNGQPVEASRTLDLALDKLGTRSGDLPDLSVLGTLVLLQDKARQAALVAHLEDARWQAHDITNRPVLDLFRLQALRVAAAAGDQAHAAAYRADISKDSAIYILSQGDGRLSQGDVPPRDIRAIVASEIADTKAYIVQHSRDLSAISYLVGLETTAGDEEIALKQVDAVIGLIDANKLSAFENTDSYGSLLSQKATLLADLGRAGEADAAYADGETRLNGGGTVDFYVNELGFLIDRGREKDAVALATRFDLGNLHPDQKAAIASLVACAFAYGGDKTDYATIVNAMPDGVVPKTRPLLCAGDAEAAARNTIAMIKDEDARDAMIIFLQERQGGMAWGARNRVYLDAVTALRKRGDVLSAASQANILIRSWPVRF
jgi:hypothetical protein